MSAPVRRPVVVLMFILGCALVTAAYAAYADLTSWQPISHNRLSDVSVGLAPQFDKCCIKSVRDSCANDAAFQCRVDPVCTGSPVLGKCLAATCQAYQFYTCNLDIAATRKVDKCVFTGQKSSAGCPEGQEYCLYTYTPVDQGPTIGPVTICSGAGGGQYCPPPQPTTTCD